MPQIGNTVLYPKQTPSINDYLIGTDGDANNKTTHNYSIKDLVTLFLENSDIEGIIQNNKVVEKSLGQIDINNEGLTIADAVNALPQFEVLETENVVFTCTDKIIIEPTGNGSPTQNPVLKLVRLKYLFKTGKGFYGVSIDETTTPVTMFDFYEIDREEIAIASSTSEDPVIYFVTNAAGNSAVNAINLAGTYSIIDGTDAYFQIGNVNGNGGSTIYRFIGAAGSYGVGATQVISSNLLTLEELGIQTSSTTNIRVLESIPLYVPAGSSKAQVINALPTFMVTQNDLYIFNVIEPIVSNTTTNVSLQSASYFLKRGKGVYGVGNPTTPIVEADFKLNYKESITPTNSPKPVDYYNFDKSEESDVVDAINASATAVVKNGTNTTVIEKDGVKYEFVGDNGSYGFGLLQAEEADIEELVSNEFNSEELKEEILDAVLSEEHTFAEKITFDKLIKLTSQATLPTAESGMIVNHNNELRFYNGTGWYTLDMTPYGV